MAGFRLGNTLSDNGSVTRGICHIENGQLTGVDETHDIFKTADGAEARNADGSVRKLDVKDLVSMNMWGFTASFMEELKEQFSDFLANEMPKNPLKSEYFLPSVVSSLLADDKATVQVLHSNDKWYGVTYKEDKATVVAAIAALKQNGIYQK